GAQVRPSKHRQRCNRQEISTATGQIRCQANAGSPEAPAAAGERTSASQHEKLQRRAKTADGTAPRSTNATGRTKACHSAKTDGAAPSAAANCTKAGEPSSRGKAALIACASRTRQDRIAVVFREINQSGW